MLEALTISALALLGLGNCSILDGSGDCRRFARGLVGYIARLDDSLLQGREFSGRLDERRFLEEDRGRRNLDLHTPLKDIGIAKKCHKQPQGLEESLLAVAQKVRKGAAKSSLLLSLVEHGVVSRPSRLEVGCLGLSSIGYAGRRDV